LSKVIIQQPQLTATTTEAAAQSAYANLQIQQQHTHIDLDEDGIPFAQPSPDFRFRHFAESFDDRDATFEASLFRLASALFDEIPDLDTSALSTAQAIHATRLARQAAVSAWLKQVTAPSTEDELRSTNDPARQIFSYLTSHQIEEACKTALAAKDLRLATLLAQASYPDAAFQSDLKLQLAKWREYQVDPQIPLSYRRIYELLSGNVGLSAASAIRDEVDGAKAVYISDGLDWKRAFACGYWYAVAGEDDPLRAAVQSYQAACSSTSSEARPALPTPWYDSATDLKKWKLAEKPNDVLFELINFASTRSTSLEVVLTPTGFSPSPLDVRLPWHLYQLLARVLRVADFEDRTDEGASARAEQLTVEYAHQLERVGLWEWACFVLLHLAYPERCAGMSNLTICLIDDVHVTAERKESSKSLRTTLRSCTKTPLRS
jgi:nuclear pore complex protein Nup98-Nup96